MPDRPIVLGQMSLSTVYLREYLLEMAGHYNTSHLLLMVGAGLNFEKAELYLQELTLKMRHFNKFNPDINLNFSTLTRYDQAISKNSLPVSYEDKVSFTEDGLYYNAGLYTSRVNLTSYIRRAS